MIMYALSAILLLIMSKIIAAAENIFPSPANAWISIPDAMPINRDEYTSFVISAKAMAIMGGRIDSHPVSIMVNSITCFSSLLCISICHTFPVSRE